LSCFSHNKHPTRLVHRSAPQAHDILDVNASFLQKTTRVQKDPSSCRSKDEVFVNIPICLVSAYSIPYISCYHPILRIIYLSDYILQLYDYFILRRRIDGQDDLFEVRTVRDELYCRMYAVVVSITHYTHTPAVYFNYNHTPSVYFTGYFN